MILTFHITAKDHGKLLREYILEQGISAKALKRIKHSGQILCNDVIKTVRYLVQEGDCITLCFPSEENTIEAQNIPFSIYYEDADYMVVYKPPYLPCIPTKRYPNNTLANAITYYYQQQGIKATVHLVNRLDKDTKGLLVVAKHSYAHYLLSKDIKQVQRIYHCQVEGILEGSGVIQAAIIKAKDSIKREVSEEGKKAITYFRTLKHMGNTTFVECRLETGRTHQIRVHMAYIKHPLVGDVLYNEKSKEKFYLESVKVMFIHPFTKKQIKVVVKELQ